MEENSTARKIDDDFPELSYGKLHKHALAVIRQYCHAKQIPKSKK